MPLNLVLGPANSAKAGRCSAPTHSPRVVTRCLVVPTAADVGYYERELAAPGVTLGRTLTFAGLIDEIAARANFRRTRLTALQRERVLHQAIAASRLQSLARSATGSGYCPGGGQADHRVRAGSGHAGAIDFRAQDPGQGGLPSGSRTQMTSRRSTAATWTSSTHLTGSTLTRTPGPRSTRCVSCRPGGARRPCSSTDSTISHRSSWMR